MLYHLILSRIVFTVEIYEEKIKNYIISYYQE